MSKTVWTGGGTTGDFTDNSNWSNQTPDATHTPGIADGTTQDNMTTNLDRSAGGVFELITTPAYTGNIGTSGTYLKWNGTSGGIGATIRGTGDVYLDPQTGNNTDVIIDTTTGTATLSGEIIGLMIKQGTVTCTATCDLGDIMIVDGSQCVVTLAAAAVAETPATNIVINGGTVTLARDWPALARRLNVNGGTVTVTGLIDTLVDVLITSGLMIYDPTNDPNTDPDAPEIIVAGGVLDLSSYSGSIPAGRVVTCLNGHIIGSPGTTIGTFQDYDLRDEYPGQ